MKYPDDYINKIICGDCLEAMKGIPDGAVDLVLTDPPYGIEFQSNYRTVKHDKIHNDSFFPLWIFDELKRVTSRAIYVCCRWDNLYVLPKPKSVIAWVKNNWSMGDLKHEHGRQWESVCFYPQENHEFKKRISDVIFANRTGNELHPTQKPVELMSTILSANIGDIVLDPFLGSGTTAVACRQLNRRFIGIEINPDYCKIARERLNGVPENLFKEANGTI